MDAVRKCISSCLKNTEMLRDDRKGELVQCRRLGKVTSELTQEECLASTKRHRRSSVGTWFFSHCGSNKCASPVVCPHGAASVCAPYIKKQRMPLNPIGRNTHPRELLAQPPSTAQLHPSPAWCSGCRKDGEVVLHYLSPWSCRSQFLKPCWGHCWKTLCLCTKCQALSLSAGHGEEDTSGTLPPRSQHL